MGNSHAPLQKKRMVLRPAKGRTGPPVMTRPQRHNLQLSGHFWPAETLRTLFCGVPANSSAGQSGERSGNAEPGPVHLFSGEDVDKTLRSEGLIEYIRLLGEMRRERSKGQRLRCCGEDETKLDGYMYDGSDGGCSSDCVCGDSEDTGSDEFSTDEDSKDPDYVESTGGNRITYMGVTPRKESNVGKAVITRMLEKSGYNGASLIMKQDASGEKDIQFMTERIKGMTYSLSKDSGKLHMAHIYPAVTFWNEIGRFTGSRSLCVNRFMHDPNNYYIELGQLNCGDGPRDTYRCPERKPIQNFPYQSFLEPGNFSNVGEMKRTLERERGSRMQRRKMEQRRREERQREGRKRRKPKTFRY